MVRWPCHAVPRGESLLAVANDWRSEAWSEVNAALMGGHVDLAMLNPGEALELAKAKKVRVLCVMAEKRHPGAADVPTCREQGVDVVWRQHRGLAAPAEIPAEARKVLEEALFKATQTTGFKKYLEDNSITEGWAEPDLSQRDRPPQRPSAPDASLGRRRDLPQELHQFVPDRPSYHPDGCAALGRIWTFPIVKGKTRLNILSALTPQFYGRGANFFDRRYVWPYQGLIVGTDPVAVDTVGAHLLQVKRIAFFGDDRALDVTPHHIQVADTEYHLGVSDLNRIEVKKLGWMDDVLI